MSLEFSSFLSLQYSCALKTKLFGAFTGMFMMGRTCGVHNETSVMCIVNIFVCLTVCALFSFHWSYCESTWLKIRVRFVIHQPVHDTRKHVSCSLQLQWTMKVCDILMSRSNSRYKGTICIDKQEEYQFANLIGITLGNYALFCLFGNTAVRLFLPACPYYTYVSVRLHVLAFLSSWCF